MGRTLSLVYSAQLLGYLPKDYPASWATLPHAPSTFLPPFPMSGFAFRPLPSLPSRFRLAFVFSVSGWFPTGATISSPCPHFQNLQYYEGSDPCPPSPWWTGIPASCAQPSRHSVPKHTMTPGARLFRHAQRHRCFFSRLRHVSASSPRHTAESGSSAYGLPVRLRLLPTPPRGGAVTFGFGSYGHFPCGLSPH
jgi:hypothetical protein